MKLALIRRQFAATGGAELYLQRLLRTLLKHGHEVHLFAEAWSETLGDVRFHRIAATGSRATRPFNFSETVRAAIVRESFDCVFSLERTEHQDVYRAGDGLHRVWLERRKQFAPWWNKPFLGFSAFHRNMMALEARTFDPQNTRHVIVNSEMVRREILQHFQFPSERIHLVRNGVDVARFQNGKREETRARFGVKDDEFLLLFVGSGWERKGLSFVLDVMAKTPRLKLLVVGKGRKPSSPARWLMWRRPMPPLICSSRCPSTNRRPMLSPRLWLRDCRLSHPSTTARRKFWRKE
jgi:UDP-glucose:(heptosyl)LPS alpha-1,3-glucosyltransferase